MQASTYLTPSFSNEACPQMSMPAKAGWFDGINNKVWIIALVVVVLLVVFLYFNGKETKNPRDDAVEKLQSENAKLLEENEKLANYVLHKSRAPEQGSPNPVKEDVSPAPEKSEHEKITDALSPENINSLIAQLE